VQGLQTFAVCQGACPCISIYMDTKSFMIHGNLLVYVRKGVAYEWLESYTGFSVSEREDSLKFYVLNSLPYSARMIIYLLLVAFGFLIQYITMNPWPGLFC